VYFAIASLRKDLARWSRDAPALLIWLGIPLLVGGLITVLVDGGDGPLPRGTLLIADADDTLLSGFLAGAYSRDQLGELITVQQVSVEEGEALIADGQASGFLVIPEGFQDAFLDDEPITLRLLTNPSQTILPGIIQDVTEILLDAGFYAQQLLGDEIARIREAAGSDGPNEAFVADVAVNISRRMEAIAPKLFPSAIDVEIVEPPPTEPAPPIALLYVPGMVMIAMLFSANGLAADYWLERRNGTLRRLVSAPGMLGRFVAGKAAAALIIILAIAGFTLALGFVYHGLAWAKFPPALLWTGVSGLALFAWFAVLQMLFPSAKSADTTITVLMFPLLMAGGSFFPLAALPDWLARIGRLAPNGFVADRMTTELTASGAWLFTTLDWTMVLTAAATGLALCAWRLQSGFARG
jgi:ABC-2 type transport system permease protein